MPQTPLPTDFLDKCSPREREAVQAWWRELSDADKSSLNVLVDRRNDSRAFVYGNDESGSPGWQVLPIGEDELPADDPRDYLIECLTEHFQHLLDHPELVNLAEVKLEVFHICVNHPQARRVAAEGVLSGDFACPLGEAACPIQKFAATIAAARLVRHDASTNLTTWLCVLRRRLAVERGQTVSDTHSLQVADEFLAPS